MLQNLFTLLWMDYKDKSPKLPAPSTSQIFWYYDEHSYLGTPSR